MYYSATASVRRLNIDEYLPYSKGDVQTLNVQYGQADVEGKDYSYFKYWLETKFYFPVEKFFRDFFETSFGGNTDRPVIFAARIIVGSSSGMSPTNRCIPSEETRRFAVMMTTVITGRYAARQF